MDKNKLIEILKKEREYELHFTGFIKVIDNLSIEVIETYGGEGEGDDYSSILKVTNNEEITYWKIPGWYQSYYGGELEIDNIFQVIPKEVTVTTYTKIEKEK